MSGPLDIESNYPGPRPLEANSTPLGEDLGGPTSSMAMTSADRLVDVDISSQRLKHSLIRLVVFILSIVSLGCIGLSLYTGCHYLSTFDERLNRQYAYADKVTAYSALKSSTAAKSDSKATGETKKSDKKPSEKPEEKDNEKGLDNVLPNPTIVLLGPAIPALFSSTIALLLLITLARFVTNMDGAFKANPDRKEADGIGKNDLIEILKSFKS